MGSDSDMLLDFNDLEPFSDNFKSDVDVSNSTASVVSTVLSNNNLISTLGGQLSTEFLVLPYC